MEVNVTNAALGLIAAAVAWIFKNVIQHGKDLVRLQEAFRYYLDRTGKGAAMELITPNPTPPEIARLLRKYIDGRLCDEIEIESIRNWCKEVIANRDKYGDKYGAALSVLASLGAGKRLDA